MSIKFKKTCFECGKKVDNLYDGKCEDCFKDNNPPVKEIKPLNLKICNMCKKIHYNNQLLTLDEIEELLPTTMKKRIILNEGYKLKEIEIEDFEQIGNKIVFNLKVDCDFDK